MCVCEQWQPDPFRSQTFLSALRLTFVGRRHLCSRADESSELRNTTVTATLSPNDVERRSLSQEGELANNKGGEVISRRPLSRYKDGGFVHLSPSVDGDERLGVKKN